MADWTRIASRAARFVQSQTGIQTSFVWESNVYTGIRTALKREDVASDEGLYEGGYQFSLLVAASQFTAGMPESRKSTIDIGGTRYRVLSVETDAPGAFVKLNLGTETA